MKRWLVVTLLIAGCGGDGATNVTPPPVRYVLYVDGAQTGIPGPFCVVTISNPTFLTLHSRPNVVDSAVATLHVAPGRSPSEWHAHLYDALSHCLSAASYAMLSRTHLSGRHSLASP